MLKKIIRKKSRFQDSESAIKPNDHLAIDDIADYRNVIEKVEDTGHYGLKGAFLEKEDVVLTIQKNEEENEAINGTITHYDDNFSQLMLNTSNGLRRVTFSQIIDVKLINEVKNNEELSD